MISDFENDCSEEATVTGMLSKRIQAEQTSDKLDKI